MCHGISDQTKKFFYSSASICMPCALHLVVAQHKALFSSTQNSKKKIKVPYHIEYCGTYTSSVLRLDDVVSFLRTFGKIDAVASEGVQWTALALPFDRGRASQSSARKNQANSLSSTLTDRHKLTASRPLVHANRRA